MCCRYDVIYGSAGFNPYGYKAGCTFATGSVEAIRADPAAAAFTCPIDEFCPAAAPNACTRLARSGAPATDVFACFARRADGCHTLCTSNYASQGVCQADSFDTAGFLRVAAVRLPPMCTTPRCRHALRR